MNCDCHIHIILDGKDFKTAINEHKNAISEKTIINRLKNYSELGINYLRDGGDNLGVSLFAKKTANTYNIEYVSPAFAIHKKGKYGSIVGKGFDTEADFLSLLDEAEKSGADFIKLMLSGIMDFNEYGKMSCEALSLEEMQIMVKQAKKRGFSVMAHVNGDEAVKNAIIAGVDSIEHGYFISKETVELLANSETVWTPTLSPIGNIIETGRFNREVLTKIYQIQGEKIALASELGAYIALGSDGGAFGVLHGECVKSEFEHLKIILGENTNHIISKGNAKIREVFKRRNA